MKITVMVIAALLLISTSANALNLGAYKELQAKTKSGVPGSEIATVSLAAYHQGIAESFEIEVLLNEGKIPVAGNNFACVPKSAQITASLIEASIDLAIGDESTTKPFGGSLNDMAVAQFALLGLGKLFPCHK